MKRMWTLLVIAVLAYRAGHRQGHLEGHIDGTLRATSAYMAGTSRFMNTTTKGSTR